MRGRYVKIFLVESFLTTFFFFILGAFVGSFLDVVTNRVARGEPFLGGRSHCEKCGRNLTWKELIPVISFLIQGGKCKWCQAKLSWEYPLVEVTTGILFALTYQKIGVIGEIREIGEIIFWLMIVSALTVLFIADLKYYLLPDQILLPTILLVLIRVIGEIRGIGEVRVLQEEIITAVGASAFFLGLMLITRGRGMGGGDVKLAFLMGLLLGWPLTLIALYSSFISGALVSLILIALRKKRFGQIIPFGPFMIFSTFLTLFFPQQLLSIFNFFLPIF